MDDLYDQFEHLIDSLDPELFSQVKNNKGALLLE